MYKRNRIIMFFLIGGLQGAYLFYWLLSVQGDIRREKGSGIGGCLTFLLILFTFGIYLFFWQWNVCSYLKEQNGEDKRVVTLILSLLVFGVIINPLIIQGQINRVIDDRKKNGKVLNI